MRIGMLYPIVNSHYHSMWEWKMERSGPENQMSGSGAVSGLNRPLTIRSNLTSD